MGPDEFSGFELADYEESIQSAITASLKGSGGDLMPYFSEQRNPGVKAKVLSAIPSVELRDGELMGCTTVRLKEPLNDVEMKALQEYLRGQFSDGWGEGFEQWEIYTEDGTLYVHFWNEDSFSFEAVPVQAAEPTKEPSVPKRPKMKLAGMDVLPHIPQSPDAVQPRIMGMGDVGDFILFLIHLASPRSFLDLAGGFTDSSVSTYSLIIDRAFP